VSIEDLQLEEKSRWRKGGALLMRGLQLLLTIIGAFFGVILIANVLRLILHPFVFQNDKGYGMRGAGLAGGGVAGEGGLGSVLGGVRGGVGADDDEEEF
jgi:hypothetical protein